MSSAKGCKDHGQKTPRYGLTSYMGVKCGSHRRAYMVHHGETPSSIKGLVVMHTCDNPRCIEPDHLRLGTQADNMQDKHSKGRGNMPKGDTHGSSKVTVAERRLIADRFNSGTPGKVLAAEYGISLASVSVYSKGAR